MNVKQHLAAIKALGIIERLDDQMFDGTDIRAQAVLDEYYECPECDFPLSTRTEDKLFEELYQFLCDR